MLQTEFQIAVRAKAQMVTIAMGHLKWAKAQRGHYLDKHVPAWVHVQPAEEVRKRLQEVVQISEDGLELLGGAIEGDFEAFLGPYVFVAGPARKRLAKAEVLTVERPRLEKNLLNEPFAYRGLACSRPRL